MKEWQPIETAPKDGTLILLRGYWAGEINGIEANKKETLVCSYDGEMTDYGGYHWTVQGTDAYAAWMKPTHWMPLPDPPEEN